MVEKERRTNRLELKSLLLQTEKRADTFRQIVYSSSAQLIRELVAKGEEGPNIRIGHIFGQKERRAHTLELVTFVILFY